MTADRTHLQCIFFVDLPTKINRHLMIPAGYYEGWSREAKNKGELHHYLKLTKAEMHSFGIKTRLEEVVFEVTELVGTGAITIGPGQ